MVRILYVQIKTHLDLPENVDGTATKLLAERAWPLSSCWPFSLCGLDVEAGPFRRCRQHTNTDRDIEGRRIVRSLVVSSMVDQG